MSQPGAGSQAGEGLSLAFAGTESWACCLASLGVLRGGPRPYHEPVTHLGGVRLNVNGRLAHRLGPESTLAAMT